MDMKTCGNTLLISATNLPDLENLLKKASKEAEQLNSTLDQLSRFDLKISFSAEQGN